MLENMHFDTLATLDSYSVREVLSGGMRKNAILITF